MSVQLVNRSTLISFIEDHQAIDNCANQQFDLLDLDGDGVLSPQELYKGFDKLMAFESSLSSEEEMAKEYKCIFEKYDEDRDGSIDRKEFGRLVKEIMLGMASIGNIPLSFVLEENSLLMKAVEHELALHG